LTVTATDSVNISGKSQGDVARGLLSSNDTSSGLFSTASGLGPAGQIIVSTPTLTVGSGGKISVSTTGDGPAGDIQLNAGRLTMTGGGLFSSAEGAGPGGNINVGAGQVQLSSGATISAKSTGTGLAGNVTIEADTLQSQDSFITTEARQADGGDVDIRAGKLVRLSGSEITTSVGQGEGKGGNITIDPQFVVLNNSQIRADAFGGPGGNITIVTDVFLSSESILSASSALSAPGTINVQAQVSDVSGNLARLPEAVLQAAALLRASCAARLSEGKSSSLVVAGREGQPPEPGGFLPRPFVESKPALARVGPAEEVRWETLPPISLAVLDPKCLR
jgi:large exoprotein involved in heme utilization and adhesion